VSAGRVRTLRRALRVGQLACLVWLAVAVGQLLTAEPAGADNCGAYTDCFGQTGSAAEATFGLTLLAGLSLVLDFVPVVGDVKGVVEAFTGEDLLTGEELEPWERALGLIPLLPLSDVGRAAGSIDDVADLAREGDELVAAGRHLDDAEDVAGAERHLDDVPGGAEPPREGGGGGGGGPPRDEGPPPMPDEPPPRPPHGTGPVVRATEGGTLRDFEVSTAHRFEAENPGERLFDYKSRTGLDDYDYYDAQGRLYDQIGNPRASEHWNLDGFTDSIDAHIRKMSHLSPGTQGKVVIDMTGFKSGQIGDVASYIDHLPADQQALITRIGF
jgi:hypothetical protein